MLKIFSIIFILTLFGCSSNPAKTDKISADTIPMSTFPAYPLIIGDEEAEGWGADIRLSFTERSVTDKEIIYKVNSIYENENIGFEICVPKKGLAKLTIKSNGSTSNNFIHVLQKLYKQRVDLSSKFVGLIIADCLSMGDYIDSLNKKDNGNYVSTAENKLFFHGESEDDYAELYLNINKTEHWIELKEKDEEYRPIIIKLLTKK